MSIWGEAKCSTHIVVPMTAPRLSRYTISAVLCLICKNDMSRVKGEFPNESQQTTYFHAPFLFEHFEPNFLLCLDWRTVVQI